MHVVTKRLQSNVMCHRYTLGKGVCRMCKHHKPLYLHVCSGQGSACPAGVAGAAGVATWIDFSRESLL